VTPPCGFECPSESLDECASVLAGKYDRGLIDLEPVILDIGAGCGAFALWAIKQWPGATIHCYEPAQINHYYLLKNTAKYPNILTTRAAVLTGPERKLYVGEQSQLGASFFPKGDPYELAYELPIIIAPDKLPQADILKLSTNGCDEQIKEALHAAKHSFRLILEDK
jgi:hypothetical protein